MGSRGNIKIVFDDQNEIYFYTHWTGHKVQHILAEALNRGRGRWGDDSYLARIIFSEMIKDDVMAETGFGIAPYETDNSFPIPEVWLGDRVIHYNNGTFSYGRFIETFGGNQNEV